MEGGSNARARSSGKIDGPASLTSITTWPRGSREQLHDYSFITLCGYEREGQKQRLTDELTRRVGHPPHAVCELRVADLVPRRRRNTISVVTPYRVVEEELAVFDGAITDFTRAAGV
ncbi:MAG TPA: hypothetical protein VNN80_08735 [Polyangiaceae bacterium]|nr:hypothetical protein [Polyangiaceae bacterium]